MKYYIAVGRQPQGPYEPEELLHHGLRATTLVWTEGMADWAEAQSIPELQELLFGASQAQMRREAEQAHVRPPEISPEATGAPRYEPRPPRFAPGDEYQSYNDAQFRQAANPYQPVPPCPKTWLAESIIVTLLCCLPFGIVGIVKASQVESLWRQGQYVRSEEASKSAGFWTKLGFFISLGIGILYLGFTTFGALAFL